jgi:MFS family permease
MGGKLKEDKTPINAELVAAGGFGKFQWFIVISMIIGQMTGGFIAHGVAYLEMPPEYPGYMCAMDTDPTNYNTVCAPQLDPLFPNVTVTWCPDLTSSGGVAHYEVDYEEKANLYNLYTWLKLGCKPKKATALIVMAVFAGSAIGCLFMPRLGDLLGRKPVFCWSLALQAPLLAFFLYIYNLKILYIGCFFFGICVVGRMSCGFLLMMELVPTANQAAVGAALMVAEGSVQIIWTVYFLVISQNSRYFLVLIVALNVITGILCFLTTESPRYLYSTNQFERCEEALMKIARWNGATNY